MLVCMSYCKHNTWYRYSVWCVTSMVILISSAVSWQAVGSLFYTKNIIFTSRCWFIAVTQSTQPTADTRGGKWKNDSCHKIRTLLFVAVHCHQLYHRSYFFAHPVGLRCVCVCVRARACARAPARPPSFRLSSIISHNRVYDRYPAVCVIL
jgi:hypothetical protein